MTSQPTTADLAPMIARYATGLHEQAPAAHHVLSPLGAWLALALAGSADDGSEPAARRAVEDALGLPLPDAARIGGRLLDAAHPAVAAALGLWWREDAVTDRLMAYAARLPVTTTRAPLAGQAALDAWASEHSRGMIRRFPIRVTREHVLVLASALATRVRWRQPFDVVPASALGAPDLSGGFASKVTAALRSVRGHDVRLVRTAAAGLVGAHVAASGDGLAVVSVLGAEDAGRAAVLAAAYEVAIDLDGARIADPVSLFDVPEGRSELGEVIEDTVQMRGLGRRVEEGFAVLPSWRASTELDLMRGASGHSFAGAGRLLAALLPPSAVGLDARQVAVASYTREGFEAAAITGLAVRTSAVREPSEVRRRTLTVRFDRPYAAVAVAVQPGDVPVDASWIGLPVFGAWVAEPLDPEPVPA